MKAGEIYVSPQKVLQAAREGYQQQIGRQDWPFYRRLNISPEGRRTYTQELPLFHGKNIIELVEREIRERKKNTPPGGTPQKVRIVDVGAGNGMAALEMAYLWGDAVEIICYGDSSLTDVAVQYPFIDDKGKQRPTVIVGPTRPEIEAQGNITFVDGNIIDIRKKLGDGVADFILLSNVVQYVQYPRFELLKKLYRVAAMGAVMLSSHFGIMSRDRTQGNGYIPDYLASLGYDMEFNLIDRQSLAFRKNLPELPSNMATNHIDPLSIVLTRVKEY